MVCDLDVVEEALLIECLNPYSTGIWSATRKLRLQKAIKKRLNPYSTGIWSATGQRSSERRLGKIVLILILLEYGLRPLIINLLKRITMCLNPYSTGIWSAT